MKVVSGEISKKTTVKFFKYDGFCEVLEVGILKINKISTDSLKEGDVGYIILNIKDVSKIKVGDTIADKNQPVLEPLEGYKPIKPMVFSGLYPIDSKDFEDLRLSLGISIVLSADNNSFSKNDERSSCRLSGIIIRVIFLTLR